MLLTVLGIFGCMIALFITLVHKPEPTSPATTRSHGQVPMESNHGSKRSPTPAGQ